jgi:hypothetical protein
VQLLQLRLQVARLLALSLVAFLSVCQSPIDFCG